MTPLHIAFCGQVRTPQLFEMSLRQVANLIERGLVAGAVIATWNSEITAHTALFERLQHPGIQVIGLNPPSSVTVPHSYFHQMTLLYGALRVLPTDALVLKTRPDILFDLEALPTLAERLLNAPPPPHDPFIFKRRVWVPQFEATSPFYVNDLLFLATRHDAMQLCNFDMSFELNNFFLDRPDQRLPDTPSSAEIRRYSYPFSRHFPLLEEYGNVIHMTYGGQPNRFSVLQHNISSKIYWQYVSLYMWILHNYFLIGRPHYEGRVTLVREEQLLGEKFSISGVNHYINMTDPTVFLDNYRKRCDGFGLLYCGSQEWTEAIFSGTMTDPSARALILDQVEAARAFSPSPERLELFRRYRAGLIAAAGLEEALS
ncbi:hypothetical protein [Azospirillum sp. B506]|uniref:hypothetical protein n=1 Tax=Azospirillum sp. B506 TaxID=137721 RepID=UPI00034BCC15|nr:hypothetical protein [Azospirillum sp. B506]